MYTVYLSISLRRPQRQDRPEVRYLFYRTSMFYLWTADLSLIIVTVILYWIRNVLWFWYLFLLPNNGEVLVVVDADFPDLSFSDFHIIALPCLDVQCANMNFHLYSLHKQNNATAILAQGDICYRMSEAGIVNNTITVSSDFWVLFPECEA